MARRAGPALAWSWIVILLGALLFIDHWPGPKTLLGDEATYVHAAQQLLTGEPIDLPDLWPPLYPYFLAALLWVGGGSLWALQVAQIALLFGVAWLVRDGCTRLLGNPAVGTLTAFGLLAYPPLVAFALWARPEILHLALLAAAMWILVARRDERRWLVLLGAVLGLSLLTRSLLGPFLPVLLAPLALSGSARERVWRVSLVILAATLVIAPNTIGSWRRDGSLSLAGSGWFNLWVGLNDHSRRDLVQPIVGREYALYRSSADTASARNEILRDKVRERIRERGIGPVIADQLPRQYQRLLDKDSYLSAQLPGGVVASRGGGYRGPPLVLAAILRAVSYVGYAGLLLAAPFGILGFPIRDRHWLWIAIAFLGYNALIFAALHVKTRYRVPCLPFLMFFAAYAVERIRRGGLPSKGRTVASAALASGLLLLAFGGAAFG